MKDVNIRVGVTIFSQKNNKLIFTDDNIDDFILADDYITIFEKNGNTRRYDLKNYYKLTHLSATRWPSEVFNIK